MRLTQKLNSLTRSYGAKGAAVAARVQQRAHWEHHRERDGHVLWYTREVGRKDKFGVVRRLVAFDCRIGVPG